MYGASNGLLHHWIFIIHSHAYDVVADVKCSLESFLHIFLGKSAGRVLSIKGITDIFHISSESTAFS